VPIWGYSEESLNGKEICVEFKNQIKKTTIKNNQWKINLDCMFADKNPSTLKISCQNEQIIYNNILVGDVWFASGQSNMCFYIEYLHQSTQSVIVNDCNYPQISLFITPEKITDTEEKFTDDAMWVNPNINNICSSHFSTVGFLFAKNLFCEVDVPIGILVSAYGGTRIETWLNRNILKESQIPTYEGIPDECAYNAMIIPHIPYAFKGMIWYQGEGNSSPLEFNKYYCDYAKLMVAHYRDIFNNPSMPFYQVGLPSYNMPDADFKNIRFEQIKCDEEIKNCYSSINYDTGNPDDIHPSDKLPIGQRLADLALEHTYGIAKNNFYPYLEKVYLENKNLILTFKTDDNGLKIINKKINTLLIEDKDGICYNLEVKLEN
ncbi:MAG: sialate O-acetylesterase, partial [Oscillospiraceae bacterium]